MPKKIIFTEEQIQKMHNMVFNERKSYAETSRYFNCSSQTIKRELEKRYDISEVKYGYKYNELFFDKIDTKSKAYWLGFISSDGYINFNRKLVRVKLSAVDEEHLHKLKKDIEAEHPIKEEFHNITGNRLVRIEFTGKQIIESFKKHGITKIKREKQVPSKLIPDKFLPDYIRGIFDADGCIQKTRFSINFCGSKEMLIWIQDILSKKCDIKKCKINLHDNTYRIQYYAKEDVKKILLFLYPNFKKPKITLDRKFDIVKDYIKFLK